jgi:AcrR family transcriptional regulator
VKRKYELKKRAESQAETRQRIVEAAIELHRTKGPARTTVSDIARLAGVQRHTFYRHFPDEHSLGLACSGLYMDRNPMPDPAHWLSLDGEERLQTGLRDMYVYFDRNQAMFSRLAVDAEVDALTRELVQLRQGAAEAEIRQALAKALPRRRTAQAALDLALDFKSWQSLRRSGLSNETAADTMARAILAQ